MDLKLNNKIALITGAGRGIGENICSELSKEGVRIIAISRNKKNLQIMKNNLHNQNLKHEIFSVDLLKKDSEKKIKAFLKIKKLKPDIIINNVGGNLGYVDPLGDIKSWHEVFRLNLDIGIELNRSLIKNMIKKKWGRIIHISSISALENQGPPQYCAAKAALNAYIRSVGRYVSKDNVILNSVMPGAIITKGGYWDIQTSKYKKNYLKDRMAIKRFGDVKEIGKFVCFLASELNSFSPGSNFLLDGGQGKIFYEG